MTNAKPPDGLIVARGEARCASPEETRALGERFAAAVEAGAVLSLEGTLGAGKTQFVKGFAAARGFAGEVSSPTFTLVHEYRGGRLALYHVDLYRLDRAATDDLGLEELGVDNGVLAIEWPDRLTHSLEGARPVRIDIVDDTTRRISIGEK